VVDSTVRNCINLNNNRDLQKTLPYVSEHFLSVVQLFSIQNDLQVLKIPAQVASCYLTYGFFVRVKILTVSTHHFEVELVLGRKSNVTAK